MSCGIADGAVGQQCVECGRLVMAHSLCPVREQAAADAIKAARASEGGVIGALLAGRWPSGDQVGTVESLTIRRFDGEYVEGMEPVEVLTMRIVNGVVVVDDQGG